MANVRGIWLAGSIGLIISLQVAGLAGAAENDGWVGREFMPKATCTPKVLNQVIPLKCLSLPFKVQNANGNWLWVGQAWVKKCDVVALDKAREYYDEYLEAHPESSWAGECLLAASRARLAAIQLDVKLEWDAHMGDFDATMRELDPDWKGLEANDVIDRVKDDWTEREFMPKAKCTPKVLNQVIPLKCLSLPFRVQKINGNWLWVGQAWVKKWDVVALDEAAVYYEEYLQRHPESSWAGERRDVAWQAWLTAMDRERREFDAKMREFDAKTREFDAEMRELDANGKGLDADNVIEQFDIAKNCDLVIVPVTLDGKEYPFIVDTGCTTCVVDTSLRSKLRETGRGEILDGKKKVELYRLPEVQLGRIRIPADAQTRCDDLTWFRIVSGHDIRGILGMNLLKALILRIDFNAGRLMILKRGPKSADAEFPLSYSAKRIPIIETKFLTGKVHGFEIDLGMTSAGQVERKTFDELLKNGKLADVETSLLLTFRGFEIKRAASLQRPRDGGFQHKPRQFNEGAKNMLGLGSLSMYDVTFDFPNDQLYLQRGMRMAESLLEEQPALPLEYEKVISDYNESIQLVPQDADAYLARSRVWSKKDDHDNVIADCNDAIRLDPTRASAYLNRGVAWAKKGDNNQAMADFDEGIRLDPKQGLIHFNRGVMWYQQGEYDKAIAGWNDAIHAVPTEVSSHAALAWLYATCANEVYRDGKRAVELATKACELTGWRDGDKTDGLAAAYAEVADFENAVKWQEQALQFASEAKKDFYRSRLELYKSGKPFRDEPKR